MKRNSRFLQWIALPISAMALTGCVGMSAPYDAKSVEPESIDLIPVTLELLTKMAEESNGQSPPAPPPPPPSGSEYQYAIGPGDILQISVPSIVNFNSGTSANILGDAGQLYVVYNDGTIYLPYSGAVKVGGLSLKEVQEAVVRGLSGYLRSPQVLVTVKEFRSKRVMITGQVEKPGYVPLTDIPLTLIGALSSMGGIGERRGGSDPRAIGGGQGSQQSLLEFADLRNVALKRDGQRYKIDVSAILASGNVALDPVLVDGDVVVVSGAQRANIFVLGEVVRPGMLEVDQGNTDLADVIMSTGGINQLTANPSRVYVIRGDYKKPTVYQVDAARPDAMLLAQRFPIQPNDVIYVSEAGATRWNRSLAQVMPTVQGFLSTAIIANTVDNLQGGN